MGHGPRRAQRAQKALTPLPPTLQRRRALSFAQDVAGKTGVTFAALMVFIREFKPYFGFLENVKTIGAKNLKMIVAALNAEGYFAAPPAACSWPDPALAS
eukprot:6389886-Pyramimonas_sp.AAC.1